MQSLETLQTFVTVVDVGSFSGAARVLGQTKSSVSKHIAKLENRLGVRLLNRTTRRMSATEAGQAFQLRCRQILDDLADAERSVTNLHDTARGLLRINAPMSFAIRYLAPVVADFMNSYSELQVDMDLNDRIVDVVEEGYDLVIRISRLPDSSLIARKVAPFKRIIAASPDYWDKYGRPQKPEDLRDHNCLIYKYLSSGNEWPFVDDEGNTSYVTVGGTFMANNGDALLAAARNGLGVLSTPSFISSDDLRAGSLEPVLTAYDDVNLNIYAVYPHNRYLSAKVRLFVDFLVETYGNNPVWDQWIQASNLVAKA